MPLIVTPSDRSRRLWGNLAQWPLRIELTILISAFLTLLFSLSSGVFHVGIEYERYRLQQTALSSSEIARRISLDVVVPILAIGFASVNIWLYSERSIWPSLTLAGAIVKMAVWIIMVYYWIQLVTGGHHGLDSMYAVRVLAVIGALFQIVVNAVYFVYSALAIHRIRIRSSAPIAASNNDDPHELESRRVSHVNLADSLNIGLKPPEEAEYPRRRTSATPSYETKGPRAEAREMS